VHISIVVIGEHPIDVDDHGYDTTASLQP